MLASDWKKKIDKKFVKLYVNLVSSDWTFLRHYIQFHGVGFCLNVLLSSRTQALKCIVCFFLKDSGRYEEAESLLEKAVEIRLVLEILTQTYKLNVNCLLSS